jgi:hypothetical protein
LELWASTPQGGLFTTWKLNNDPNADWAGWSDFLAEVGPLPGAVTAVAVAPLPDGSLELWASTAQGGLFTTWKLNNDPNADWAGWSDFLAEVGPLPGAVTAVAVAPLSNGSLELWASTAQGGLFTTWKLTAQPDADWAGWSDFLAEVGPLPDAVATVAIAPLSDGSLELWASTAQGGLFTTWKLNNDPNADWAGWSDFLAEVGPLPGAVTGVAVAPLSDGSLELWASTAQGGLFTCWKFNNAPDAGWAGWSDFLAEVGPLPGAVITVAVAPLADGRLELWARTVRGGLFTTWKVAVQPDADWAGWSDFLAEALAPIESRFTGTASFSTADTRFTGPFLNEINLTIFFVADGTARVGPFPRIVVGPFGTPLGSNTITITMTGGGKGTFNKASGSLSMPITLHFDHSLAFAGDSDVTFGLTTASSTSPSGAFAMTGIPLNAASGVIALVGASRFRGGFLNGTDCSVMLTGTLVPIP